MKALVDTSILLPALMTRHPNSKKCTEALRRIQEYYDVVVLNTHLAAELYANLTRFPKGEINPKAAAAMIRVLREKMEVVDLTMDDYMLAVDRCANKGLVSRVIYDALHLQAAIKADVDVLYTENIRDFTRLLDDDDKVIIRSLSEL